MEPSGRRRSRPCRSPASSRRSTASTWPPSSGSGPGGRIEKQDVLALIDAAPAPEGELELSRHRRAVAERLTRSVQTIPQFSVAVDVDMSSAAAHLAEARADGLAGLTYTHLLLRATAGALREHPAVNRLWVADGPRLRQLERADVGLAVAGEDTLLVPTIAEPDLLELSELVELTGAGRAPGARGQAHRHAGRDHGQQPRDVRRRPLHGDRRPRPDRDPRRRRGQGAGLRRPGGRADPHRRPPRRRRRPRGPVPRRDPGPAREL